MTGFGVGEASHVTGGKLIVEIRAVNHRYLDVRVRAAPELAEIGPTVEGLARERLGRGRFDIVVRAEGAVAGEVAIDRHRARSAYSDFVALRNELAPEADVPLSLLSAVPNLFVATALQGPLALAAIASALDAALGSLDAMRRHEGALLAEDLVRRLGAVRTLAATIAERSPVVIKTYKTRLLERAERLRAATDIEVDGARLEHEIALFADRIDIAEELTRLESHATHFEEILGEVGAVGRRFDFLLQEMAREANTIGAKSQDAIIAHAVVDLKAEIERMREQVQNIE